MKFILIPSISEGPYTTAGLIIIRFNLDGALLENTRSAITRTQQSLTILPRPLVWPLQ